MLDQHEVFKAIKAVTFGAKFYEIRMMLAKPLPRVWNFIVQSLYNVSQILRILIHTLSMTSTLFH